MANDKVYDAVFKRLATKTPELAIYMINYVFKTKHNPFTDVDILSTEYVHEDLETIYADLLLGIGSKRYHIECQSTQDASMIIRMFEYDSVIALREAKVKDNTITVNFPDSAVIYLRSTQSTPSTYTVRIKAGGKTIEYAIPTLDITDFDVVDLFSEELYMLLPYLPFKYSNKFEKMDASGVGITALKADLNTMSTELRKLCECNRISKKAAIAIVESSVKVINKLTSSYSRIRKELLDMYKAEEFKFSFEEVEDRAREEGREEGREEADSRRIVSLVDNLMKTTGVSLEKACELLILPVDDYYKAKNMFNK